MLAGSHGGEEASKDSCFIFNVQTCMQPLFLNMVYTEDRVQAREAGF